ncbi:MAG TPA: SIMPL domain-containing protein [Candidatus Saccharimonadales bacterium]|nr:SIMPL domain-containing protein [Candidatus Saccharimonadales bacterium]
MPDNISLSRKLQLTFDLRIVSAALLVIIVAMILIWKPWSSGGASGRTVEVTGQSTITATPDEYVFYPSYQFSNADKAAALDELTKKSDEVVARLKGLGVADSKIKTNSNGYGMPMYYDDGNKEASYNLQLTVTVGNLELAQKVQDYLVATTPDGSVSPQTAFSDRKEKELDAKARDEATKDARKKGEQMAENLGFSLGKVKSVQDSNGFGKAYPMSRSMPTAEDVSSSFALQPGENELSYSVTVTYFIK